MSGWFVLSAVFVVLTFGLFFTFTERKSWPERRMELGPADMRLAPPVSTIWCEAVALHSDHSFVAYQVNHATRINSKRLSLQRVNLAVKLGSSWTTNFVKLKYFLLPSSVVEIVACSRHSGVKLMVFKGDLDVQSCLQSLVVRQESKSSVYDSDEDSSEEDEIDDMGFDYHSEDSADGDVAYRKFCSTLIAYHSLDVSYMDAMTCNPRTEVSPVKVNVTSADSYVIVAWNTNRGVTNHVDVQVMLDRTRYTVHHKSGHTFDLCSLATSCTIGLGFATGDRVLVSIPEEPNSGRSSFVVRTRCKPRLAVFAVLSVLLPLLLFLAVAFVVRADREKFGRLWCKRQDTSNNRQQSNRPRIVAPLLDDRNVESFDECERAENTLVQADELPPPYHTLYDPPPSYSCVKESENKNSQAR